PMETPSDSIATASALLRKRELDISGPSLLVGGTTCGAIPMPEGEPLRVLGRLVLRGFVRLHRPPGEHAGGQIAVAAIADDEHDRRVLDLGGDAQRDAACTRRRDAAE